MTRKYTTEQELQRLQMITQEVAARQQAVLVEIEWCLLGLNFIGIIGLIYLWMV